MLLLLLAELVVGDQTLQESLVLALHVVGENLDGEVSHALLSVVVLELSFHHDVKALEQKAVEVLLHLVFSGSLLEESEGLSGHAHDLLSIVPGEVNPEALSKVGNLASDHVSWVVVLIHLATTVASVLAIILEHLLAAVVILARWIEDSVVVLDP